MSRTTTPYSFTSANIGEDSKLPSKLANAHPITAIALSTIVPPLAKIALKLVVRHPVKAALGLLVVSTVIGRKQSPS